MDPLSILRKLLEQQQFETLKQTALRFYQEEHNPEILPLLANAYAHLGQIGLARDTLQKLDDVDVELNADSKIDLAAAHIKLLALDVAESLLKEALQASPEHALGLARLALINLLHENLDKAASLFEQSAAIEPERIPVLNHLVQVYVLQERIADAQVVTDKAFDQLTAQAENLSEEAYESYWQLLWLMQMRLWVVQEQFAEAEQWLTEQQSLQQQGELEEKYYIYLASQYARTLAEYDHHQQASEFLKEAYIAYPLNIALCTQLVELLQLQGQFMQAVRLIKHALKEDQDSVALWVQLANVSLHRFDKQARKAAEKAVELIDQFEGKGDVTEAQKFMFSVQAKNALAQVEAQEQHFELAETLFKEVLAEHEYFLPALQGLGQQYMQEGRIDEAVVLFEKIKQVDPVKGFSSLINARQYPDDETTLEKIEKAAQQPSLEGPVRAGVYFQLAAAWEKRKDYDKAFECAVKANEASKRFLPYDAKKHRNHCARIRAGFCRDLYDHRKAYGVDSNLPVYVLGMPRSGTTLVEQIISGHSEIFGAGELGVIPQVVQGLNRWERRVGSGRQYPDCMDDLTPEITEGIANNVLKELQEYAPEARYVVDKLPHNFENIGLIKFLFPNAKIISVRRDPRDIAMSNYFTDYQAKHGGMGFAYDLTNIGEQLADHNLLMHHWHQVFPGEILELNYEDVVDDLEGSARKMLNYIGVDWEPEVLKFNELDRAVKTASVWQVRQPIYKTSKAKWKRYENYLQPLIQGTNKKIEWDPIEMITLPEPGFLQNGVAFYKEGKMAEAELSFKKMLHHNPEHAACHYMLGLVYMSIEHAKEGIEHLEKAVEKCPWQKEWRENLIKAYEQEGLDDKIEALKSRRKNAKVDDDLDEELLMSSASAS